MKFCSKCKKLVSKEFFSINRRAKDGLHAWCKECYSKYEKERYQQGDKIRKEKNKKDTIQKRRNFIWDILQKSQCAVCKNSDPIVLEFDHLDPNNKEYDIASMFYLSEKKIIEEIKKCQILCANCHRKKTAEQFGWWRNNKQ